MTATDRPDRLPAGAALSTTVFGATALGVAAYTAIAAILFAILVWQANRLIIDNVLDGLDSEATAIARLAEATDPAGLRSAIDRLAEASAGSRLYYLGDRSGTRVAGNLARLPSELASAGASGGGAIFTHSEPGGSGAGDRYAAGIALVLSDGRTIVVAKDIERQRDLIWRTRAVAVIAFLLIAAGGLAVGYLASRSTLARVGRLSATTRAIMAGELSRRLPLAGSDDEFDRLSESVNRMLDRIEQLMYGLKEVSDNIAHDLKTPVSRLRQRAEAALRTAKTPDDLRSSLGETIEAADDIIKTFNALLLIARLEAGAIEETKAPVRLDGLIRDAAELYEPVAEEAGLSLEVGQLDEIEIVANRHLVGQAVVNLIDNAIKYGRRPAVPGAAPVSPSPVLRLSLDRIDGRVEISVADNGPGISAEDRIRATERFVRLDRSRTLPGTGLGLSLVAAVARLHHGELRLEDNAPGLRAIVSLPL